MHLFLFTFLISGAYKWVSHDRKINLSNLFNLFQQNIHPKSGFRRKKFSMSVCTCTLLEIIAYVNLIQYINYLLFCILIYLFIVVKNDMFPITAQTIFINLVYNTNLIIVFNYLVYSGDVFYILFLQFSLYSIHLLHIAL